MIYPVGVMAGEVGELPYRPRSDRGLTRALAANEDCHATQIDKNLRRATSHRIGSDRGAEHLHVPIRRGFGILADDVNVVEFEGRIAHNLSLICEIGWAIGSLARGTSVAEFYAHDPLCR